VLSLEKRTGSRTLLLPRSESRKLLLASAWRSHLQYAARVTKGEQHSLSLREVDADECSQSEYHKRGFQEVISPNMYNVALWKQSGHWQNYAENMFKVRLSTRTLSFLVVERCHRSRSRKKILVSNR
jgi:hypothetical protein